MTLKITDNGGNGILQGTIYLIPMSGSFPYTMPFALYGLNEITLDLSSMPPGLYMMKIDGVAVGTSEVIMTVEMN